jgi:(p)ppGpp synthase/HD superfamily hydrolase
MLQIEALKVARFFATVKHGGQLYGGVPYTHHLAAVEAVLRRFEEDVKNGVAKDLVYITPVADRYDALLVATWLHDVVEDTPTKLKEIAEMFGHIVSELVGAVTNEKGENRKVRAALTYPKIRSFPGAVALKLADRIANVENGGKLVDMYRKEYEDFRRALYTAGQYEAMWAHLDKLLAGTS